MNERIHERSRLASRSTAGTWLDHHLYSIASSLGRLVQRPFATLLTVGVIALALALPLVLWLALTNVQRFAGDARDSREISLFLKPDTTNAQAGLLAEKLRARPDVARVDWKTPEQGLAQLRRDSGLGDALDALEGNPLPNLLVITPRADDVALGQALRALPEADVVQQDAVWRQRLEQWLNLGRRLALVLMGALGAGALLVIGNTVRLDIQSRRDELGVLQLLGASDGFIRRPFLYMGAWYGLAAGLLALFLVMLARLAVQPPIDGLAQSYGGHFALQGLTPTVASTVMAVALALGWLGAGLVTGHFLRQTRPAER